MVFSFTDLKAFHFPLTSHSHSAVQESLGCYDIPFTVMPTKMNCSKFNGVFQFHKVHNLSSLIGYDFMVNFGCNIRANFWPSISLMPYQAYLVSSSLKTIFSQGCPEAPLEGCQGCQLTPLEFWRLAQLNQISVCLLLQKSD